MTAREAVRRPGESWSDFYDRTCDCGSHRAARAGTATDEELIAEMERLGNSIAKGSTEANAAGVARLCARMLRERKVKL